MRLNLDIHPQTLARRVFNQRRHRHGIVGVEHITWDRQVCVRVFIRFAPTLLLFLLTALFFAQ